MPHAHFTNGCHECNYLIIEFSDWEVNRENKLEGQRGVADLHLPG